MGSLPASIEGSYIAKTWLSPTTGLLTPVRLTQRYPTTILLCSKQQAAARSGSHVKTQPKRKPTAPAAGMQGFQYTGVDRRCTGDRSSQRHLHALRAVEAGAQEEAAVHLGHQVRAKGLRGAEAAQAGVVRDRISNGHSHVGVRAALRVPVTQIAWQAFSGMPISLCAPAGQEAAEMPSACSVTMAQTRAPLPLFQHHDACYEMSDASSPHQKPQALHYRNFLLFLNPPGHQDSNFKLTQSSHMNGLARCASPFKAPPRPRSFSEALIYSSSALRSDPAGSIHTSLSTLSVTELHAKPRMCSLQVGRCAT